MWFTLSGPKKKPLHPGGLQMKEFIINKNTLLQKNANDMNCFDKCQTPKCVATCPNKRPFHLVASKRGLTYKNVPIGEAANDVNCFYKRH